MNQDGKAQSKSPLTVLKLVYLNGNRSTELFHYVHSGLIIMPLRLGFHRRMRLSQN